MLEIEQLNKQLQKKFNEEKNYYTLERYVMSELLSPIEDYLNAISIIKKNQNLIEGLNLYYIAVYLSAEWEPESTTYYLKELNGIIDRVEDKDKAIIYYLNAYYISCSVENWQKCEKYRFNLLKSVEYSRNIKFVNYWLSSQRFIDEFILGTHLSEAVYIYKFGERMEG